TITVLVSGVGGTVKDGGGKPVGGATVQAYHRGAGAVCSVFYALSLHDALPIYSFGLPAGTYKFWIIPPAPLQAQWNGGGGVDFASAAAVAEIGSRVDNITRVALRDSGTVKDAGGTPVGGATVQAYQGGAGAVCC